MAEYRLPHEIFYEIKEPITVEDVIESLLGTRNLLVEIGPLLEACIPGLKVDRIEVSIKEVSESSLKELYWIAIFGGFQPELDKEVPNMIEELTGITLAHSYHAVTSVLFLLMLFYGVDYAYKRISKIVEGTYIQTQLDGLIAEVATKFKIPEDRLRKVLDERYGKDRLRPLVKASLRVFRPSKQHGNAAMRIGGRRIEPRVVAEVPGDAQALDLEEPPQTRNLTDVEIELHAQDLDHNRHGWAAVVPSVSKQRARLELYPPIRPIDIYTLPKVRGDVIAVFKEGAKGQQVPAQYLLVRLTSPPAPTP